MTGKVFNDNKDLTAGIDAHVPLYWRIVGAVAQPALIALLVAIAIAGFRLALSVGVAS